MDFTYPTPQGLAIAWRNHERSGSHRAGGITHGSKRFTYKGRPWDLRRYSFDKAADWLAKKQESTS